MSDDHDREQRLARAAARRSAAWLRRTSLGEQAPDPDTIAGADAVALVLQLSETSWALGGRPIPSYSRAEIPFRFVRYGST